MVMFGGCAVADPMLQVKAEARLKDLDDEEDDDDDSRKGGHHHLLPPHHMFKEELGKECGVPVPATKPKIWSLADTAACKTPPPQAGWGYRGYYYPEVQADTPPQTPPNMKLPAGGGYQGGGVGAYQAPPQQHQLPPPSANPGYYQRADHQHSQHQEETAFKPFYKR